MVLKKHIIIVYKSLYLYIYKFLYDYMNKSVISIQIYMKYYYSLKGVNI